MGWITPGSVYCLAYLLGAKENLINVPFQAMFGSPECTIPRRRLVENIVVTVEEDGAISSGLYSFLASARLSGLMGGRILLHQVCFSCSSAARPTVPAVPLVHV